MAKGPKLVMVLVALAAGFFFLRKTGVVPGANPLGAATYAKDIPVYPGAHFTESGGGNYYDEIGGPVTAHSTSWFFTHSDPKSKVVEFYRSGMPAGTKPMETDDDDVGFEWIPPGVKEGDHVYVRISDSTLQIGEVVAVKPGS